MKNNILFLIKSKLNINVKGPNIQRFIKRLKNNNIEILNITYISNDEVNLKIYKYDYDTVIKLKTIYEINIINFYGIIKIQKRVLNNKYIIIFIIIASIFIYIISNMIFSIDIITNDSKMESALLSDLNNLGIKKYRFKKSYENLQEIKSKIISTYRDEIEWIEIESIGTKYIVRYEPRIKNKSEDNKTFRNIVAKKNAIIKNLNISSGQIVKGINSYVKKGDIIVSGYIDLNGNIKDTVSSNGIIYGETWYKVTINYPFKYEEVYETGKKNKVLVIKFLNKEIEIFNFNKFKTKKTIDNTILKNSILPIKLISQYQKETKAIKENNNEKQLIKRAFNMAKKKIEENLDSNESISNYKILNKIKYSDSVTLNIFFTVIEDITEYQEIEEYKEETIQE